MIARIVIACCLALLTPALTYAQLEDPANDEKTTGRIDVGQGFYREIEQLCLLFMAAAAAYGLVVTVRKMAKGKGGFEVAMGWLAGLVAVLITIGLIRALAFGLGRLDLSGEPL